MADHATSLAAGREQARMGRLGASSGNIIVDECRCDYLGSGLNCSLA
jgi:hypothetical protein